MIQTLLTGEAPEDYRICFKLVAIMPGSKDSLAENVMKKSSGNWNSHEERGTESKNTVGSGTLFLTRPAT